MVSWKSPTAMPGALKEHATELEVQQCLLTPIIDTERGDVDGGAEVLEGDEGDQRATGMSAETGIGFGACCSPGLTSNIL